METCLPGISISEDIEMKKNIKIVLEYDGSRYDGWQKQGNTDNTIQEKIEAILYKWSGEETEIHGSGRTDAGVHARGQVANFHISGKVCPNAKTAMDYLNQYLPEDIRVLRAEEMPERFHSRLLAVRKTYSYSVDMAPKKNVFERKYVWGLGETLDIVDMRKASEYFIGEHDFKSFCSNKKMKKSTVRRIESIHIEEIGSKVVFSYTGNGFLYNMVRILTGTLVEVGQGKRKPEEMKIILAAMNREAAGMTAPPEGLFLESVEY